jgi:hypothetical protein
MKTVLKLGILTVGSILLAFAGNASAEKDMSALRLVSSVILDNTMILLFQDILINYPEQRMQGTDPFRYLKAIPGMIFHMLLEGNIRSHVISTITGSSSQGLKMVQS